MNSTTDPGLNKEEEALKRCCWMENATHHIQFPLRGFQFNSNKIREQKRDCTYSSSSARPGPDSKLTEVNGCIDRGIPCAKCPEDSLCA